MENTLLQNMNSISLEDEEEGGFAIEEEIGVNVGTQGQGIDPKLCVVGRFISEGKVDFVAMQHTMAALWKPGRGVFMKELDMNLYLFQFYHEVDVKRVMEGCPWSFNRRALVMARLKERENPRCVDLNFLELWVQVHDLRIDFISEKILTGIGNYIGKFVKSCPSNFTGAWRDYMRIRVSIDLRMPLKRRMKIKMTGDDWYWVNLKYENVPTFCFICGIIGHSDRFCSKLFEVAGDDIAKPFGSWMRAPFRNQIKPIGARWLRNGTDIGETSAGKERKDNDGTNQDPKSTPENMEIIGHGGNSEISNIQNLNSEAGNTYGNNIVTDPQRISEHLNKRNTNSIETKKRRTDDGLDTSSNMGLNKNVFMEFESAELTEVRDGSLDNNNGSKNEYVASIHGGARLPS